MLIDKINNNNTPDANYNFANGDLTNLVDELKTPRQDFDLDKVREEYDNFMNEDDNNIEDVDIINNEFSEPERPTAAMARAMAKSFIIGGDSAISGFMSIFNDGDATPFKLSTDEKREFVESLTEVLKYHNAQMSPTWGFVILFTATYGGKAATLIELRKQKKLNDQQAEKIAELKQKLQWEQRKNTAEQAQVQADDKQK